MELIMKHLNSLVVSFTVLTLLTACSSIKVATDFDPTQDFDSYKTYKIYDGDPIPNDALSQNPLIQKRVYSAIDEVLQSKGFTKVNTDDADIVVLAHAGVSEKMRVDNYGGYRGYGWYDPWWGPYGGYSNVSYYEEGSLVIDVVDVKEKELSWRGVGTGTIGSNPSPEEAEEKTLLWVSKILEKFPPGIQQRK
jgi:hypothetical protein